MPLINYRVLPPTPHINTPRRRVRKRASNERRIYYYYYYCCCTGAHADFALAVRDGTQESYSLTRQWARVDKTTKKLILSSYRRRKNENNNNSSTDGKRRDAILSRRTRRQWHSSRGLEGAMGPSGVFFKGSVLFLHITSTVDEQ